MDTKLNQRDFTKWTFIKNSLSPLFIIFFFSSLPFLAHSSMSPVQWGASSAPCWELQSHSCLSEAPEKGQRKSDSVCEESQLWCLKPQQQERCAGIHPGTQTAGWLNVLKYYHVCQSKNSHKTHTHTQILSHPAELDFISWLIIMECANTSLSTLDRSELRVTSTERYLSFNTTEIFQNLSGNSCMRCWLNQL